MSNSNFSDIRLHSDDPMVTQVNEIIRKANLNSAVTEQVTISDTLSPLKLFKSQCEISDKNMTSAYAREITEDLIYVMPLEPDGDKLRLDIQFDNIDEQLQDWSYTGNQILMKYNDEFPKLMNNTEDDGITAGRIVTLFDGKQHHVKIPISNSNSLKKMFQSGKQGFSIIKRCYAVSLSNEALSNGSKRANLFYFIENDQIEYSVKAEISDNGIVHFYVKQSNNSYYIYTQNPVFPSLLPPSYITPDYDPTSFDTVTSAPIDIYPIPYIDIGFSYNFQTHEQKIFINGQQITTIQATIPNNIFPIPFADPPPPPPQPQPFIKPFETVYSVNSETGAVKINAVTVSNQVAVYNVPAGVPFTVPLTLLYSVAAGAGNPGSPFTSVATISGTDNDWTVLCKDTVGDPITALSGEVTSDGSTSVPLLTDTGNSNNCIIAGNKITSTSSGLGQVLSSNKITQVTFMLKGANSPTGSYYAKIWDASGTEKFNFGAKDSSTLSTSVFADVTWTNTSNTVTMGLNWTIGVEYSSGGASNDTIFVARNQSNPDGSVCQNVVHSGDTTANFSTNTTYDIRIKVYKGSGASAAGNMLRVANKITSTSSGSGQTMNGQKITKAQFTLKGGTAPTGLAYCKIWDNTGAEKVTLGSIDTSTITTGAFNNYQFTNTSNNIAVASGWYIGIEYTTGNTTSSIYVSRNNTNPDTSVCQSSVSASGGSWVDNTTYDMKFQCWTGLGTSSTTPYHTIDNSTNGTLCGEFFGTGSPMIGNTPTLVQFSAYRSATAGTINLKHKRSNFADVATLLSIAVTSLPTTQQQNLNIAWQNVDYPNQIQAGDMIVLECTGVTGGSVFLLTNYGNTTSNDYDSTRSCMIYKNSAGTSFTDTTLDIYGQISSGGAQFSGYISLDNSRVRTGEKIVDVTCSLIGKTLTRIDATMKKFNSPAVGPITCVLRDVSGTIKTTFGTSNINAISNTDTTISFINRDNTAAIALNDTISLEYSLGTSTDYLLVQIDLEGFETTKAGLFESLSSNPNTATIITNRDLSGTLFTGGVTDTTARYSRGIKINAGSTLIGKAISELDCRMKATGTFSTQDTIYVYIIRGSDKQIISNIANIAAQSIGTTSFLNTYFQNINNTYLLQSGDYIAIECNFGDKNNYIEIKTATPDQFDGTNTCMFEYDGNTFTDNPTTDMSGSLLIGGYLVIPDPTDIPKPTPYHYYHGWFINASIPPDSNALNDPDTLDPDTGTYFNTIDNRFRIYSMLLTDDQFMNYYINRFTISNIAKGYIRLIGNDLIKS